MARTPPSIGIGIILPANMDGVPGLSFDGIGRGETYHYRFTLHQGGTYWYHSHSGFQEQAGSMARSSSTHWSRSPSVSIATTS